MKTHAFKALYGVQGAPVASGWKTSKRSGKHRKTFQWRAGEVQTQPLSRKQRERAVAGVETRSFHCRKLPKDVQSSLPWHRSTPPLWPWAKTVPLFPQLQCGPNDYPCLTALLRGFSNLFHLKYLAQCLDYTCQLSSPPPRLLLFSEPRCRDFPISCLGFLDHGKISYFQICLCVWNFHFQTTFRLSGQISGTCRAPGQPPQESHPCLSQSLAVNER